MNIYPYKMGSQSANDLAQALGIKQIKLEGSKLKGNKNKLIINWGSSTMSDEVLKCEIINKPEAVAIASNKLEFFKTIETYNRVVPLVLRVTTPRFVCSLQKAKEYFDAGYTLVCRTILNGHSGAGIILMDPKEHEMGDIPNCQLYVMYQPKKSEYRVHVLNGDVVDIQKKVRRVETPDDQVNWKIRNHDNGFNYARNDVAENVPKHVLTNSINAVKACGLDFGAVDVIYNEKNNMSYVLEVNTAPGLTGETLDGYRKRFEEIGIAWKNKKDLGLDKVQWDALGFEEFMAKPAIRINKFAVPPNPPMAPRAKFRVR